MSEDALKRQIREANREKQAARAGWGTSKEKAQNYLAAVEHQIEVAKEIRRIGGEGALGGNVSAGIEALKRDAANIRAEIPELPD